MNLEKRIGSCVKSLALGLAVSLGSIFYPVDSRADDVKSVSPAVTTTANQNVERLNRMDIDKIEEFAAGIKYVPFDRCRRIKLESDKIEDSRIKELEEILRMSYLYTEKTSNNYILKDKQRFTKLIYDTSKKIGYKNFDKMSIAEFIRWNANLVMYWHSYYNEMLKSPEIAAKVDGAHLDELLYAVNGKKGKTFLICRNISPLLQMVFDCTKDINPNLKNTYCISVVNQTHMWNLFVTLTKKGPYAVSIDPTLGDNTMAHMQSQLDFSSGAHRELLRDKGYVHLLAAKIYCNENGLIELLKRLELHQDFTDKNKIELNRFRTSSQNYLLAQSLNRTNEIIQFFPQLYKSRIPSIDKYIKSNFDMIHYKVVSNLITLAKTQKEVLFF
ncbi:MAG: hypothetical protein WC471_00690 [Candidatus Woesearchaeota archaeon]